MSGQDAMHAESKAILDGSYACPCDKSGIYGADDAR
jgi:hypothetical protein